VGIGVSLALLDPELQATLEPGTPSPKARLDLVRRIRAAGLPCGVFIAPLLPHLTDTEEQLDALTAELAEAGVTGVSGIGLHLRPGAREWFFHWLDDNRPDLLPAYQQLYSRGANLPKDYRQALSARVRAVTSRYGLGPSAQDGMAGRNSGARRSTHNRHPRPVTGVPGDRQASFPRGILPAAAPAAIRDVPDPVLF